MALKNRSRVEIMYDIVSSARTPARKTHLMYKSNLSFKQLDMYLDYVVESGLLEESLGDEGAKLYGLTGRGLEFIDLFEHLQEFFPSTKRRERMKRSEEGQVDPLLVPQRPVIESRAVVPEPAFIY